MITRTELKEVNNLHRKKGEIVSILRSFESEHVWAKVGIVAVNGGSQHEVRIHDASNFFHSMTDIETALSVKCVELLKAEVMHIDAELSKYITPDGKLKKEAKE